MTTTGMIEWWDALAAIEIPEVLEVLAMPIALVIAARVYSRWVRKREEDKILQACRDDLNTDYKHFKDRTSVNNCGRNTEFLHILWFTDSYKRVLLDAPSQKEFDRDKLRTLIEKMKQDNKLFYKIDKLPSKDPQLNTERYDQKKKEKIKIWCQRRRDYQKTIRATICKMLNKELL